MATREEGAGFTAETLVRTNEPPHLRVGERFRELIRRREVLVNLSRKELKVKYKSTVLGVAWSMLNPLLYLAVFFTVFTLVLRSDLPNFAVYLLSGLLPWTLFSTGFQRATVSVVDNAPLVTKVAFPREVLPLSAIGASLTNFFFQFLVLAAFMVAILYPVWGANLVLLPLSLVVLLMFTVAVSFLTSAVNVRYRDTTHLVELGLVAWFWFTPIVYPARIVAENGSETLLTVYLLNPMANIVLGFQRALYGGTSAEAQAALPDPGLVWYAVRLGVIGAVSLFLLYLTWRVFFRMSGDFAEEL